MLLLVRNQPYWYVVAVRTCRARVIHCLLSAALLLVARFVVVSLHERLER